MSQANAQAHSKKAAPPAVAKGPKVEVTSAVLDKAMVLTGVSYDDAQSLMSPQQVGHEGALEGGVEAMGYQGGANAVSPTDKAPSSGGGDAASESAPTPGGKSDGKTGPEAGKKANAKGSEPKKAQDKKPQGKKADPKDSKKDTNKPWYKKLAGAVEEQAQKLVGKLKGKPGGNKTKPTDADALAAALAEQVVDISGANKEAEGDTASATKGQPAPSGKGDPVKDAKESPAVKAADKSADKGAPVDKDGASGLADDPGTENFIVNVLKVLPTSVSEFEGLAQGKLASIKANQQLAAKYAAVSDHELFSIIMYTTNAYAPINAILRGQLRTPKWTTPYGSYAAPAVSGLRKLPDGARNYQGKAGPLDKHKAAQKKGKTSGVEGQIAKDSIDANKGAEEIIKFDTLYRNLDWSPPLDAAFEAEYKLGSSIEEPAFMSTTLIKDSFKPNAPVKWTLKNVKGAKSLLDLSVYESEKEALFPPGQRFRIDSIVVNAPGKGRRPVPDPTKEFPEKDPSAPNSYKQNGILWEMSLTHVGGMDKAAKKPAASKATAPDPGQKVAEPAAPAEAENAGPDPLAEALANKPKIG